MEHKSSPIPRGAVRGAAWGVLFMAFFGTLWASIGIGGLQGWGSPWVLIAAIIMGLTLLACGISLFASAQHLSNQTTEADARRWKRARLWFGLIFTIEGAAIGAASAICSATDRFGLFFPVMAIIVGVHFIPLSTLFQVKTHYVTGLLLCLLAIFTLLFFPERVMLEGRQIITWWLAVGFGSALILWGTGLSIWIAGQRMKRR
ncbi:DUF7010 family protein [Paenibacillus aceris]|uniref:MFS family permease n=1 Tax=Paenibacillus aceris TaxID=869555 RepID=A0ABS4I1C0_9BACL|nr:hypothetical protein [Paenibacillus aceris]MBP1964598.1 MFS family permease [Paenibacillus aceris]NHW35694.1 hypothetical protein [Paenibacillus aceris]